MKYHRKFIVALGLGLTLSACASSQGPAKALPPSFVDAAMEAALAETIAEECRYYRYNQAREDRIMMSYARNMARAGYTPRDLTVASASMQRDSTIQRKALTMVVERNIDPSSERSWCAAGKREKARGTNIGKYLI